MKTRFYSISILSCAFCLCSALQVFAQNQTIYIAKLEVKEKQNYVVGPGNMLKVDTLIMHDRATITFNPSNYAMLEAKVAIIGDKCLISAKGADGKNGKDTSPGEDGENGSNFSAVLNFKSLGKLTIDTRGGDGGAGANGKNGRRGTEDRVETRTYTDPSGKQQTVTVVLPGEPGTDGSDATMGGNGGKGGNVMLMYSTSDFIPVFNQESRNTNSIVIYHTAGRKGRTGEPGKGGRASKDGAVIYSENRHNHDGHVELINLATPSY